MLSLFVLRSKGMVARLAHQAVVYRAALIGRTPTRQRLAFEHVTRLILFTAVFTWSCISLTVTCTQASLPDPIGMGRWHMMTMVEGKRNKHDRTTLLLT